MIANAWRREAQDALSETATPGSIGMKHCKFSALCIEIGGSGSPLTTLGMGGIIITGGHQNVACCLRWWVVIRLLDQCFGRGGRVCFYTERDYVRSRSAKPRRSHKTCPSSASFAIPEPR